MAERGEGGERKIRNESKQKSSSAHSNLLLEKRSDQSSPGHRFDFQYLLPFCSPLAIYVHTRTYIYLHVYLYSFVRRIHLIGFTCFQRQLHNREIFQHGSSLNTRCNRLDDVRFDGQSIKRVSRGFARILRPAPPCFVHYYGKHICRVRRKPYIKWSFRTTTQIEL